MTTREARIANFLAMAFSDDEFQRFSSQFPDSASEISNHSSIAKMTHEFVSAMARRSALNETFRNILMNERPLRKDEIIRAFSADQEIVMSRNPAEQLLSEITITHWFRDTPRGLVDELTTVFPETTDVKRIVESSARILREYLPGRKSLSVADISTINAREAWETSIQESAKISPQALAALLIATKERTENTLPLTTRTLELLKSRTQ